MNKEIPGIVQPAAEKMEKVMVDKIEVKVPLMVEDCIIYRGNESGRIKITAQRKSKTQKGAMETFEAVGGNLDEAIKDFKKNY